MAIDEQHQALAFVRSVVRSRTFDYVITGVILLQAVALVLEATPALFPERREERGGVETTETFIVVHNVVVAVFIAEAGLRLAAHYPKPQNYFRDGWNSFDFAIIILSLLPVTGTFSTIGRVVRLLRVTRLVTKSTELRAIVSTLVRSIPSIFNILILLAILFFIYAIVGYHLFADVDPVHWSSFLTSMTTLFQIITLEGWVDVMAPLVSELGPLYWLYPASFIIIGTFIIINLFVSVIVRKSEEAYRQVQRESEAPLAQQDVAEDIKEIRRMLEDLERRMLAGGISRPSPDKKQADPQDG